MKQEHRICESCGVEENSFGAGYTQEMENEMADFLSGFMSDGEPIQPKEICCHPKFKVVGFEPSIFINWNRVDDKPLKGL